VAQHRLTSPRTRASLHYTVDILDLRTGTIHILTSAAAASTNHAGRYFALYGVHIIRADDFTKPGFHRYCWSGGSIVPVKDREREDSGRAVRLSPYPVRCSPARPVPSVRRPTDVERMGQILADARQQARRHKGSY
jgi:hypothetical protein